MMENVLFIKGGEQEEEEEEKTPSIMIYHHLKMFLATAP